MSRNIMRAQHGGKSVERREARSPVVIRPEEPGGRAKSYSKVARSYNKATGYDPIKASKQSLREQGWKGKGM